jgi:FO synthase subunit 1
VMPPDQVVRTLRHGASAGCTEALFTFGERPQEVPGFTEHLSGLGYESILQYCRDLCEESIRAGLLPHTNAGILTEEELASLRGVNASMGLMLETTARIGAHRNSPGKDPELRIATIEAAGRLRIPFTTGLLLGIGETPEDREESLGVIRDINKRYGHIQEVIIQNFCPKPGTPLWDSPSPGISEMCETVRLAREILSPEIAIQAPPNLIDVRTLIECGVSDLGGISPVTVDYVNPEHPWPAIEELRKVLGEGIELRERLCIYPRYIRKGWYPPHLEQLIRRLDQYCGGQGLLM